jgi:hypothetical protein
MGDVTASRDGQKGQQIETLFAWLQNFPCAVTSRLILLRQRSAGEGTDTLIYEKPGYRPNGRMAQLVG